MSCWRWPLATTPGGYGVMHFRGKVVYVHRFVYEQITGRSIPKGMHTDHLCRVTNCCNPDHLEIVTAGENARRGSNFKGCGPCAKGHSEIVHAKRRGRIDSYYRWCRVCHNDRERERQARLRAAKSAGEFPS